VFLANVETSAPRMAVLAPADEDPESRNPRPIATTMTTREDSNDRDLHRRAGGFGARHDFGSQLIIG